MFACKTKAAFGRTHNLISREYADFAVHQKRITRSIGKDAYAERHVRRPDLSDKENERTLTFSQLRIPDQLSQK